MEIQGKVWGDTTTIENRNGVCVNLITCKSGGHCSWHLHKSKYNRFVVIDGALTIEVEKNDYSLTDKTHLFDGDSMTVKPGEMHRFIAETDTVALEVYWVELTEDIERRSCGGAQISEE